jgi:pimeloyl-ACP methyl ester carboxylesterase
LTSPWATETPLGTERVTATTDRGRFAALVNRPASDEPVGGALLIPGFTGSKEDFATVLPLLAEAGWLAAAYDQRGQYESAARDDDDFTLAGLAADVQAIRRALFPSGVPVHLVGHSFGGLVAGTAAVERRHLWASLTLMCSGPAGFGDTRPDLMAFAQLSRTSTLETIYAWGAEQDRAAGIAPEPPEVEAFLRRRFLSNSQESLAVFADILVKTPDRTSALAALDLPIAVLRGEADDKWPHDVQAAFAGAVGAEVTVIEGAGHSPAADRPHATAAALIAGWTSPR